ncbi:hypothetical protein J6W34_02050 [bacterium]|nr:hypothetical protein [bacterium]
MLPSIALSIILCSLLETSCQIVLVNVNGLNPVTFNSTPQVGLFNADVVI